MRLIYLVIYTVIIIIFSNCNTYSKFNKNKNDLSITYYIDSLENIFIGINEIKKEIRIGKTVFNNNKPGIISLIYHEFKYENIENDFGVFSKQGNVEMYFNNPIDLESCNYVDSIGSDIIYPSYSMKSNYYFKIPNNSFNCYKNSFISYGKKECFLWLVNSNVLLNKKIIINEICTPQEGSFQHLESVDVELNNKNIVWQHTKPFRIISPK